MKTSHILAIVLVVIGISLFVVGMNASDSMADQMSNFFTGHFTDTTMWYMLGGVVLAVCGVLLFMFDRRLVSD